jgi:hypothetical protein
MALDVRGGPSATAPGTILQQWPFWDGKNQIFHVTGNSNGTFTIKPTNSGLCVEVAGNSGSNGAAIDQKTCDGATSQEWKLTRAAE